MKAKTIAISASIIGVVIFVAYCMKQRKNDNPKIFYKKNLANNYNSRVLPPFGIFIKEDQKGNTELIEHEMVHWRQFQKEGLLPFFINYLKGAAKYGYDKNPYEVDARKNETEYCQENYTECVRNGTAKTVQNPDFRS